MADEGEKGKEPEETRHAVHDYEKCTDEVCGTILSDSGR